MLNFKHFLAILFLLFSSCKERQDSFNSTIEFSDTSKQFKKEIPTYKSGKTDLFYLWSKSKREQLGLDSIENGFNKLQIRVWYDYSFKKEQNLVQITNKGTNWNAIIYTLQVDWDGYNQKIISKKLNEAVPKSGWIDFANKLLELKIVILPDCNSLPNYELGADGETYSVEIATKNQYRFYNYWSPTIFKDSIWQAKNMVDILTLLEKELGVKP